MTKDTQVGGMKQNINMSETVKIWHIIDGPYGFYDTPLEYWPFVDKYGRPIEEYSDCVYLLAKIEYGGEISDVNYWFDNFDDAYKVVKKLKVQLEPIVVEN